MGCGLGLSQFMSHFLLYIIMLCLDKIRISSFLDNNTTVWYITFTIRSSVSLYFNSGEFSLFVDECSNIKNIDSTEASDHDYYITNDAFADGTYHEAVDLIQSPQQPSSNIIDEDLQDYIYILAIHTKDPSTFIQYLDGNIKYVAITGVYTDADYNNPIKVEGVFYDPNELYHAEIRMLNTFCDTCLDDKQMQLIMLLTFKRQLLEQSIQCGHHKESLQYYLDLCRILNIYVAAKDKDKCGSCLKYENSSCIQAYNDTCIQLQKPVCNGTTCLMC